MTSHWPLASAYGAQQRVLNIGRLLSRLGSVSFVIVPSEHEDEETRRRTESEFEVCRVIRPSPAALDKSLRLRDRLRHEFDATYMATDPYAVSQADRNAMQKLLQQYDLVWVHTIRTVNWFRFYRWPHSILDVDDLPSRTYQSAAQSGDRVARRLLDLRMAWIWHRRERMFQKRFDVLVVCSEDDRRYLGMKERIHVVPNGSPHIAPRTRVPSELLRVGFIGNCEFMPNEEGIKWFIRNVWPTIKRQFPTVQLRIVGRSSDGYLTKLGPDIVGLGWLQDPGSEIATWSAMIVPIRVGSGTRVKVAEGFARKCPVVATPLGAFGYDVHNAEEILLADNPGEFASACIRLLSGPQLGDALCERAHKKFLERWTWDSFESTLGTAVQECLARSRSVHSRQVTTAPATGGTVEIAGGSSTE